MACAQACSGDVVIIAGRGHETVQTIAGCDIAFSDAEVARELLGVGS
jgi:UDP-N-acetylmuramoyl-L-alanyl-D-glutamate--2,6-diaminopimelate ligase